MTDDRQMRIRELSEGTLQLVAPYLHDAEQNADLALLILSRLPDHIRRATLQRAVDELEEKASRPAQSEMVDPTKLLFFD